MTSCSKSKRYSTFTAVLGAFSKVSRIRSLLPRSWWLPDDRPLFSPTILPTPALFRKVEKIHENRGGGGEVGNTRIRLGELPGGITPTFESIPNNDV